MRMRDGLYSGRAQRQGRRGLVLAAALVVLALVSCVPAFAANESLFKRVGTLPIDFGDGVIPDGAANRILVLQGGASPMRLVVIDPKTLKRVRTIEFPSYFPQYGGSGKPRVHIFDAGTRRLQIVAYSSAEAMSNAVDARLVEINVDSFRVVSDLALTGVFPSGTRVLGLTRQPNGRLLAVAQVEPDVFTPLRATGVVVAELNPASLSAVWGPVVLRRCQAAITNYSQSEAVASDDAVFLGCSSAQAGSLETPGVQGIVAVERKDPTQQSFYFLPGTYGNGEAYADVAAQRLLLVGPAPGSPAQAVWVFDAKHRVFVGQVAPGDLGVLGAGLNPTNGRLYMGATGAVLVTSGRGFTIPQALSFDVDTNLGPLTAIPFNSTVVVPTRGSASSWIFRVYRDSIPEDEFRPSKPINYSSLDALTTDAPQFNADAQAFGLRIHRIGGVNNALQNVFTIGGNYWSTFGNATGLKDGDRDLYFARIARAHLSQDEASAEAISAAYDASTESDYGTIHGQSSEALPNWPHRAASCGDFGGKPGKDQTEGSISGQLAGSATGECSLQAGLTKTTSTFGGVSIPGVIAVGASESGATLQRDPKRGLISSIFAEARNVTIFGVDGKPAVHIGLVRSEVEVSATGVAHKALGEFRRIFKGVVAGSVECADDCDPSETARAIAEQLGATVRVEIPTADKVASPGGARGHALRNPWEHLQDVVINNQDETEMQIPALRLTFVNDRSLASRLIVDIAATKGDATSLRIVPSKPEVHPTMTVVLPRPPIVRESPLPRPPDPPPPPPDIIQKVIKTLGHGWKVLTAGHSGMLARSVGLWLLFVSPLFFAARRRVLRHVSGSGS